MDLNEWIHELHSFLGKNPTQTKKKTTPTRQTIKKPPPFL